MGAETYRGNADDLRDGFAGFNLMDFSTGMIFDFISTGQKIGAMYERLLIRSEEHTSELQSQSNLVCRLLLEKKKTANTTVLVPSACRAMAVSLMNTWPQRACNP